MKDLNEMTPIELNVLINKTKENHEFIKSKINVMLDEIQENEKKINIELKKLENIEEKYVELMGVLMLKQDK